MGCWHFLVLLKIHDGKPDQRATLRSRRLEEGRYMLGHESGDSQIKIYCETSETQYVGVNFLNRRFIA